MYACDSQSVEVEVSFWKEDQEGDDVETVFHVEGYVYDDGEVEIGMIVDEETGEEISNPKPVLEKIIIEEMLSCCS